MTVRPDNLSQLQSTSYGVVLGILPDYDMSGRINIDVRNASSLPLPSSALSLIININYDNGNQIPFFLEAMFINRDGR